MTVNGNKVKKVKVIKDGKVYQCKRVKLASGEVVFNRGLVIRYKLYDIKYTGYYTNRGYKNYYYFMCRCQIVDRGYLEPWERIEIKVHSKPTSDYNVNPMIITPEKKEGYVCWEYITNSENQPIYPVGEQGYFPTRITFKNIDFGERYTDIQLHETDNRNLDDVPESIDPALPEFIDDSIPFVLYSDKTETITEIV